MDCEWAFLSITIGHSWAVGQIPSQSTKWRLLKKPHRMQRKHNSASIESLPVISKAACSNSLLLTYSSMNSSTYCRKTAVVYSKKITERQKRFLTVDLLETSRYLRRLDLIFVAPQGLYTFLLKYLCLHARIVSNMFSFILWAYIF